MRLILVSADWLKMPWVTLTSTLLPIIDCVNAVARSVPTAPVAEKWTVPKVAEVPATAPDKPTTVKGTVAVLSTTIAPPVWMAASAALLLVIYAADVMFS